MTTLHEMTHVLGFSSSLFPKFLNKPKTGTKNVNGFSTPYIDISPLTEKVRSHFGCSTGVALLENQGGSGSIGSHFERRSFMNEYMSASAIADLRITKFTLALLEGSGWYQVDYDMTDQFHWGKGEGCTFLNGACKGQGFSEFCPTIGTSGCNFHRTHGSYCGNTGGTTVLDSFADNCPYFAAYSNQDCSNSGDASRKVLSTEFYGIGSRCFTGTLYNAGGSLKNKRAYCMKYNCVKQTDGTYDVQIVLGDKTATCRTAGSISVSGYTGVLDCPNPDTFCKGVGIKYCERGCLGRGVCTATGTCKCNSGFTGSFCQTPVTKMIEGDQVEAPAFDPQVDVIYESKTTVDVKKGN